MQIRMHKTVTPPEIYICIASLGIFCCLWMAAQSKTFNLGCSHSIITTTGNKAVNKLTQLESLPCENEDRRRVLDLSLLQRAEGVAEMKRSIQREPCTGQRYFWDRVLLAIPSTQSPAITTQKMNGMLGATSVYSIHLALELLKSHTIDGNKHSQLNPPFGMAIWAARIATSSMPNGLMVTRLSSHWLGNLVECWKLDQDHLHKQKLSLRELDCNTPRCCPSLLLIL